MSRIRTDSITDALATGPVDFPDGLTVSGVPVVNVVIPPAVLVTSEGELDTAIAAMDTHIQIVGSFSITTQKVLYSNVTIEMPSSTYTLTGDAALGANEAMFFIPTGVQEVRLLGLNMATAQTDIDCIAIDSFAIRSEVSGCKLVVPALTTRSAIYCDGQLNRIINNDVDCNGSVSSPGCIFLDVGSINNVVSANIVS